MIHLEGEAHVFEVEFEAALLSEQLSALKRSSLQALYTAAEEMAARDGLTGLHNHRSFQEALTRDGGDEFAILLAHQPGTPR